MTDQAGKHVRLPTAAVKRDHIASTAALSAKPRKKHRTSIANAGMQVAKAARPKSRGTSAKGIPQEDDESWRAPSPQFVPAGCATCEECPPL
jgi:hypothetical protein